MLNDSYCGSIFVFGSIIIEEAIFFFKVVKSDVSTVIIKVQNYNLNLIHFEKVIIKLLVFDIIKLIYLVTKILELYNFI